MKSFEATGRWGFGLLKLRRGKMGALCLAIVAIALSLGSPSPGLAQQAQGNPVGTWTSSVVINGIPTNTVCTCRADGTFTARATAGAIVVQGSGRWSYANGIITSVYDNGWFEQSSVVWVNPNQMISTCLRSSLPEAVGLRAVCNRVR